MTSSHAALKPPTFDDVEAACRTLAGRVVLTPLLESPLLNAELGGRLLIKAEVLQRTGSFKYRGALNRISAIPEGNKSGGVVAYSSGNHAQGVAAAAQATGMKAIILMPVDAPRIKVANTKAWGAEVRHYDRRRDNREAIGAALAHEFGSTLVKPYDDPLIIAGQGTVGVEIVRQAAELGASIDAVLVPCGGGGLTAGTALAFGALAPAAAVFAVEPEAYNDTARSLASGRRESVGIDGISICDALQMPTPGETTFEITSKRLKGALTVSDKSAQAGMRALFNHFKIVAEPSGAVGVGAVLSGTFPLNGRTVVAIISGGNVDAGTFCDALGRND
jgi:threonine dehydratase